MVNGRGWKLENAAKYEGKPVFGPPERRAIQDLLDDLGRAERKVLLLEIAIRDMLVEINRIVNGVVSKETPDKEIAQEPRLCPISGTWGPTHRA